MNGAPIRAKAVIRRAGIRAAVWSVSSFGLRRKMAPRLSVGTGTPVVASCTRDWRVYRAVREARAAFISRSEERRRCASRKLPCVQ